MADITEEMRVAAVQAAMADAYIHAMGLRGAGLFRVLPSIVDVALKAALAGRTVVDLPEPNRREDECGVMAGYWHMQYPGPYSQITDVMSYEIDGQPVVYTGPGPDYLYTVAAMRERCLAGLAACADAERLASESSGDGEPR